MIDISTKEYELAYLYSKLLEKDTFESALEEAREYDFTRLINYLLSEREDKEQIRSLVKITIFILQHVFNNTGEDLVPDELYDRLHSFYLTYGEGDIVGAPGVGGRTYKHSYPLLRGTISKIHFFTEKERGNDERNSLENRIVQLERLLGEPLPDLDIIVSLKVDGVSAVAECDENGEALIVLKRGEIDRDDDLEGEAEEIAIMRGVSFTEHIPEYNERPFGVKNEICMTEEDFERYKEKYGFFKTARSATTSIINSDDYMNKEKLSYLTVIPLQIQFEGSPPSPIYDPKFYRRGKLRDIEWIRRTTDELQAFADSIGLGADGVVIRIEDEEYQQKLGRDGSKNRYEFAYKFPAVRGVTKLKYVDFSIGLLGGITPVAKVEPLKIGGVTVKSIGLGSMPRLRSLELHEGQDVEIRYDVIPYLVDIPGTDKSGKPIVIPTHCPVCQEELTERNGELSCENDYCDSRNRGRIVNFINKVRIPEISIATVDDFYAKGFLTDIPSLYRLHEHTSELVELKGYGPRSIETILDNIESRRELYDYEVLGAVGIVGVGQRIFKKILSAYTLEEFLDMVENGTLSFIKKINGVGDSIVESIYAEFFKRGKEIKDLLSEVKVTRRESTPDGSVILFTKVRDKEFQEFLDSIGHTVVDSYNSQVDVVIRKDEESMSSKVTRAMKDGKLILTLEQAKHVYGYDK